MREIEAILNEITDVKHIDSDTVLLLGKDSYEYHSDEKSLYKINSYECDEGEQLITNDTDAIEKFIADFDYNKQLESQYKHNFDLIDKAIDRPLCGISIYKIKDNKHELLYSHIKDLHTAFAITQYAISRKQSDEIVYMFPTRCDTLTSDKEFLKFAKSLAEQHDFSDAL